MASTSPAPSAAVEALLLLAKGFVARGQPVLAIKCYLAICQSKHELPAVEAFAHVRLGRLLLDHSHNVLEAQQALSKAQLLLERTTGNFELKCEALSGLGRCKRCLRRTRHEQQTYARAITLCRAALATSDRLSAQQWLLHFHLRAARLYMSTADSVGSAVEALETSVKLAAEANSPLAQALCQLFKAQLLMTDDSRQAETAHQALDACQAILDCQASQPQQQQVSADGAAMASDISAQLRLHHALLRCLLLLSQGSIATLAATASNLSESSRQGNMDQAVRNLQDLFTAAMANPWGYEWLSPPAVAALVHLVSACMLRPSGKLSKALAHLEAGQRDIAECLDKLKIKLKAGQSALSDCSLEECKALLALKVLLTESTIRIQLLQHALPGALAALTGLNQLLAGYPSILQAFVPSVQMLLGHYATACGETTAAASHFSRVACDEAVSPQMRRLAMLHACLAEANSQQPNWVGRAQALLATSAQHQEQPSSESLLEKGLRHLVSGLMQLAEGDEAGGKVALSRALKLAHGELGDHQMVSQVLNALAPVHLGRGDVEGATSMLTSSFTLAHDMKDLPSQIASLQCMDALHARQAATGFQAAADKRPANQEYMQGKLDAWSAGVQRVQQAESGTPHAALLASAE
ncbi:hypothetical protein WJX74_008420 [Apatococcus lobatus]|uniref:Uncharacterized protein n=1 Tax=Apatococcus lobatus TaxID=904363 RepID=A0AAW1R3T3_9CHLO